ncbi:MAG: hypothetical protein ABIE07_11140 [Candidatus Zixiibacteriota bacterium]
MNRKEKLRQYLLEQVNRFSDYERYRKEKDIFFNSIEHFKREFIAHIERQPLIKEEQVKRFANLLATIVSYKTKSTGPNEVYWNAVSGPFGSTIQDIYKIIADLEFIVLPFHHLAIDFFKDNWAKLLGVLALIVPFIIYFLST